MTLGDSSEGNHPISEDAKRLLGRKEDYMYALASLMAHAGAPAGATMY